MMSARDSEDDDELIDEDPPPTWPMKGTATFSVEDKCIALFTSAEWELVATVKDASGAHVVGRSMSRSSAHTEPFTRRWVRQLIRTEQFRLRRLGVDVDVVYQSWGGILEDLG